MAKKNASVASHCTVRRSALARRSRARSGSSAASANPFRRVQTSVKRAATRSTGWRLSIHRIIRVIQHAELADQCARLALPLPCAVAFGFHGDQRAQGGANAGLEGRRTPERARHARLERLLRRALGLPVRLRGGDAGFSPAQIARQRQGRGFGDLVLAVKEVRGVVRTEVRLGMPTQRLGLVGGALDHLHGKPRAGVLKRRRPGRRGAIRGVLLQRQ